MTIRHLTYCYKARTGPETVLHGGMGSAKLPGSLMYQCWQLHQVATKSGADELYLCTEVKPEVSHLGSRPETVLQVMPLFRKGQGYN